MNGSETNGAGRLSISGVSKLYGRTRALDGIDLDVEPGEFLSLLGPSGCGKTTLLRCVAGLIEPDRGTMAIDAQPLDGVPPWRRDVSVVFQSYALFPHMSVAQNVAFGLKMRGLARAATEARVAEALGLVRMDELGHRYPAELSGGQQQRVALARAIVVRPRILLLDEPMAALDAKLRMSVQREIRQLQTSLGITTILVTHDQAEAMSMSDRIAVMNAGRIEQLAAPQDLYARPGTPFVAEFVGDINRIHGRIETVDGARRFVAEAAIDLPVGAAAAVADGPATLLIRPESVRVTAPTGDGIAATVEDRVQVGDRIMVYLRAGPVALRSVTLNINAGAPATIARGDAVTLDWSADAQLVFAGHV